MGSEKVTVISLPRGDAKENWVQDVAQTWDFSLKGIVMLVVLGSLVLIGFVVLRIGHLILGIGMWVLVLAVLVVPLLWKMRVSSMN